MKKPTDRFSLFGNKENESDKIKRDTVPAEIAPYYVRPKEANPLIDKEFQTIASATEDLYWQTGAPNYSFQSEGLVISASHIIKKKIKEQSPVKVLDVGAGNFMFERQNKKRFGDRVVIYGLAANDMYRKASLRQADEYHQFKNAEYLAEIYEKTSSTSLFQDKLINTSLIHLVQLLRLTKHSLLMEPYASIVLRFLDVRIT
ncbi:hypothetical protein [Legionella sp.]|uniref:hypothetical protein n=1 Tax=Legionella sp. TaxID=459 RepID=UPI000CC94197|nr:hypothetical protein [Legionella sp.]PJE18205.1 MAG: hypothetical protein CK430_00550 [Legionella sp.]